MKKRGKAEETATPKEEPVQENELPEEPAASKEESVPRSETERRRRKQKAYNEANGIVPQTITKSVRDLIEISTDATPKLKSNGVKMTERERKELIASLESKMRKAAEMLEYEIAAQLRDEIIRLRGKS